MFRGAPNTFYLPFPPPQVSFKQQTDKAVAPKNTNGDKGRGKKRVRHRKKKEIGKNVTGIA